MRIRANRKLSAAAQIGEGEEINSCRLPTRVLRKKEDEKTWKKKMKKKKQFEVLRLQVAVRQEIIQSLSCARRCVFLRLLCAYTKVLANGD